MNLKLADFGFAQHLDDRAGKKGMRGSPLYMAPEILLQNRYDARLNNRSARFLNTSYTNFFGDFKDNADIFIYGVLNDLQPSALIYGPWASFSTNLSSVGRPSPPNLINNWRRKSKRQNPSRCQPVSGIISTKFRRT